MGYEIVGLGHAISDIEIKVEESFLEKISVSKGTMTLIDAAEREKILAWLPAGATTSSSPGGSVANSLTACAKLGHSCCLFSGLGNDMIGEAYLQGLKALDIAFPLGQHIGQASGSCLVLITPDAERTMLTTLGCSSQFLMEDTHFSIIETCKLVYLEGYMLAVPETVTWIRKVIAHARQKNIPNKILIALSLSDSLTVSSHLNVFKEINNHTDILLGNANEFRTFHELTLEDLPAIKEIGIRSQRHGRFLAVTMGARGSYLWDWRESTSNDASSNASNASNGDRAKGATPSPLTHIPAEKTKVIDSTGAGDAYAAGILHGILEGKSLPVMGKEAASMASTVISRFSARY